jgi:hypothetical protein
MVIANRKSINGKDYVDVLRKADLHDAFERAWGCRLLDHDREEKGLESVSEDTLIEKTLEVAEDLWGFSMRMDRSNPVEPEYQYHLIPFEADTSGSSETIEQQEMIVVSKGAIQDLNDAVKTVVENRPDDPEIVSYALDDIENILYEIDF